MSIGNLSQYQFGIQKGPAEGPDRSGFANMSKAAATRRRTGDTDADHIVAHHPEHGVVGVMGYSRQEVPNPTMAKTITSIWVHPQHRGQFKTTGKKKGTGGVAEAMYGLASRDVGYDVAHSATLSPRGAKFANRVGGPHHQSSPRATPNTPNWEIPSTDYNNDVMTNRWAASEKVDTRVSNALLPVRQPRRKPQGEQQSLPLEGGSMESSAKMGTGTSGNAQTMREVRYRREQK